MSDEQYLLIVFLGSFSAYLVIYSLSSSRILGALDRRINAFSSYEANEDFKRYYKDSPISLIDFAIKNDWSRRRAENWLDKKAKEFSGIKERQINGDYFYYFGKVATKLIQSQQALIDEVKES